MPCSSSFIGALPDDGVDRTLTDDGERSGLLELRLYSLLVENERTLDSKLLSKPALSSSLEKKKKKKHSNDLNDRY